MKKHLRLRPRRTPSPPVADALLLHPRQHAPRDSDAPKIRTGAAGGDARPPHPRRRALRARSLAGARSAPNKSPGSAPANARLDIPRELRGVHLQVGKADHRVRELYSAH